MKIAFSIDEVTEILLLAAYEQGRADIDDVAIKLSVINNKSTNTLEYVELEVECPSQN